MFGLVLDLIEFFVIIIATIGLFSVKNVPFVFAFFFIFEFASRYPVLWDIVPGHQWITFFIYVGIFEAVTFFLMLTPLSRSVIFLSCCLFVVTFAITVFEKWVKPDSVPYCVSVSVIYGLITLFIAGGNIHKFDATRVLGHDMIGNHVTDVFAGLFYGIGVAMSTWCCAEFLWKPYYAGTGADWSVYASRMNIVYGIIVAAFTALVIIYGIRITPDRRWARKQENERWQREQEQAPQQPRHL